MMKYSFSFLIFFLFNKNVLSTINPNDDLLAVVVVYRHGDRAPIFTYPTDPYPYTDPTFWPLGDGQLTNQGKERQFKLGQWLRNRYDGFLSRSYSGDEIKITSTNVDRTFMSAYSNLAGLYPPDGVQVWNPTINWQPIPVRTEDPAVPSDFSSCIKIDKLLDDALSSDLDVIQFEFENPDLFDYLSNKTGTTIDTLSILGLRDTIFVDLHNNYQPPDWAMETYSKLEEISQITFSLFGAEPLKKLTSGPFLNRVVDYFKNVAENGTNADSGKFLMFSGHDLNVLSIMAGLGAPLESIPFFGSSVIFELRQKAGGAVVNNYPVLVKDCLFNCELELFELNLRNILIGSDQWNAECELTRGISSYRSLRIMIIE